MNKLAEYGPPAAFFSGVIIGAWFVIKYNLQTMCLVHEIEKIARSEGKEWRFFGVLEKMLRFLFNPGALIESSDSVAVVSAKQVLLEHRKGMWVALRRALIAQVIGVIVAVAIPVGLALGVR